VSRPNRAYPELADFRDRPSAVRACVRFGPKLSLRDDPSNFRNGSRAVIGCGPLVRRTSHCSMNDTGH